MVDESTDNSEISYLCINVRYADSEKQKVVDTLWDVVSVYDDDENSVADAETLFNKILTTFTEAEIDLNNIIAFTSDGANVMKGCNNSINTRFVEILPDIIDVNCKCHKEHLCARDAIKVLPTTRNSSFSNLNL